MRPINETASRGIGLIELMVALALSAILVLGVTQVYVSAKATYNTQEGLSRLQENGRIALMLLQRDIRNSDYWGCMSNLGGVTNHLDDSSAGYDPSLHSYDQSIDGAEGGAGSDSLILRSGAGTPINVTMQPSTPAAALQVSAGHGLAQGDVIFVSDCQSGDVYQISNSNPGSSNQAAHNTGVGSPGNKSITSTPGCPASASNCLSKLYDTNARIFRAKTVAYSVQTSGVTGEPALVRSSNGGAAELADGVESFQILYGEDTDNDGVANRYVPANLVADWDAVVAIRVGLLMRTDDQIAEQEDTGTYDVLGTSVGPFNDRRLRKVFTATVGVRNRLK
ncbi:MAG: hypothetical protein GWO02_00535 [Gammaproteobacteria bacterium]|nr:hypothetical protein [Gammaproteobacteria bacterium]